MLRGQLILKIKKSMTDFAARICQENGLTTENQINAALQEGVKNLNFKNVGHQKIDFRLGGDFYKEPSPDLKMK